MTHCYILSVSAKNSAVLKAYNATYSQNTSPQNMYTILIWIICRGLGSCGVLLHSLSHKDFLFMIQRAYISSELSFHVSTNQESVNLHDLRTDLVTANGERKLDVLYFYLSRISQ